MGGWTTGPERERRLDALYVAVRDGATVDRQAAFDIAMNELEYFPLHAEARELAEASVADDDETRLTSAAAAFLDAYGYEPGFEQAPERFARLERALDAVRADMRATGLTGEVRLVRPGWTPATQSSRRGRATRGGRPEFSLPMPPTTSPRSSRWPSRLVRRSWSRCCTSPRGECGLPARRTVLGTSPEARHGTGVWWCDGGDGHVAAEIGHWAASQPLRYRNGPGQSQSWWLMSQAAERSLSGRRRSSVFWIAGGT